jgi:hypothetical protein
MQTRLRKFLNVLRIELEDLEADLAALVEFYKQRKNSHEITNYVYLENKGLLINELRCIANLLDRLAAVDTSKYDTVDAMIDDMERMIAERARQCAFPDVVSALVTRKIQKVRKYIASGD